eukprot:462769_1
MIVLILILICLCCTIYWFICSKHTYRPNNGLKFPLPPQNVYPFKHRWMSFKSINSHYELTIIDNPTNTKLPCIHYIDENTTNKSDKNNICFLLLHGNPTWSFLYRKLIIKLTQNKYHCISLDYPGFGLSTAPEKYTFTAKEHTRIVLSFVKTLKLKNIIICAQDWGGPIGFNFAVETDANIIGFVIGNTWIKQKSKLQIGWYLGAMLFSSWIGQSLSFKFNFIANCILRHRIGFHHKLTEDIEYWYKIPFKNKNSRKGTWMFAKQVYGAKTEMFNNIENKITERYGKTIPILILWGTCDLALREKEINVFKNIFTDYQIIRLSESAHFWQEDQGDEAADLIVQWIKNKTGYVAFR